MARHAYWSGQIKIALVYLPVQLQTATRSSSQIDLDQIHGPSGERIHYAKVLEDGTEVEKEDIVKGYKDENGDYIIMTQDEIDNVKLPSSDVLELVQFVDLKSIPLYHFEKPYYITPNGKEAGEIYVTIRDALKKSGKAGIGQLALRGREDLCAVLPYEDGLILEVLRYDNEVKKPDEFFGSITNKTEADNVEMALELIKKRSSPLKLEKFEDHYHDALLELINSKRENRKPQYVVAEKPKNVINLMDALRKSLHGGGADDEKPKTKSKTAKSKTAPAKTKPKAAAKKPKSKKAA